MGILGAGAASGIMRSSLPSFLNAIQLLGLASSYQLDVGFALASTLQSASIVLGNAELLALDCHSSSYGFFSDWSISVVGAGAASGVCIVSAGLLRELVERLLRRQKGLDANVMGAVHQTWGAVFGNLLGVWRWALLCLLHPWIILRATAVFSCERFGDGLYHMSRNPSVVCYTETWRSYAFAASFVLFGAVVVAPGWMVWTLWVRRERLLDRTFSAQHGTLYFRYRPGFYWFEIVLFFARALLGALPALPTTTDLYVSMAMQVAVAVLILVTFTLPHLYRAQTILELLAFAVLYLVLAVTTLSASGTTDREQSILEIVVLVLVIAMGAVHCVVLARSLFYFCKQYSTFELPFEQRVDERIIIRRSLAPTLYRHLDELPPDERAVIAAACLTMQAVRDRYDAAAARLGGGV